MQVFCCFSLQDCRRSWVVCKINWNLNKNTEQTPPTNMRPVQAVAIDPQDTCAKDVHSLFLFCFFCLRYLFWLIAATAWRMAGSLSELTKNKQTNKEKLTRSKALFFHCDASQVQPLSNTNSKLANANGHLENKPDHCCDYLCFCWDLCKKKKKKFQRVKILPWRNL